MELKGRSLLLYFIILEATSVANSSTITERSDSRSSVQVPFEANYLQAANDNLMSKHSNSLYSQFSAPDDSSESDYALMHNVSNNNLHQISPLISEASFSSGPEDGLEFKAIELKPAYMLSFDRARESRRFNIFNQMWTRPRASPLYLVNGTVCRFLNNVPICTTLQTTGLMPPSGSSASAGASGAGARPTSQGVLSGASSVQFAEQPSSVAPSSQMRLPPTAQSFGSNQPRPAAVLEDDSQDINVASAVNYVNSTSAGPAEKGQLAQQWLRPANLMPTRQLNFLANRRPLNLLARRRPIYYNAQPNRRTNGQAATQTRKQAQQAN